MFTFILKMQKTNKNWLLKVCLVFKKNSRIEIQKFSLFLQKLKCILLCKFYL